MSSIAASTTPSPDELYQELFDAVQLARIFPDSKTFCDALPRNRSPSAILDEYRQERSKPSFDLRSFVMNNFIIPQPNSIEHGNWTIVEHCHRLWPMLTRTVTHENWSSFIDVPDPFVVPGGRFREFYYWDTYFTMLGLRRSNQTDLIQNMLDNFAHLIRSIGHIPNGNRNYYAGRSQPPFFSLMTELAGQTNKYQPELELEYAFWMNARAVKLDDGSILNRYYDDRNERPRPEAFFEDSHTAEKRNDTGIYVHLRSAAESGWDFSSRWMDNEEDLSSIMTANILPVDLNCLLYHLEMTLGKKDEAQRRRQAIQKYMWSEEQKFFVDYNFERRKQNDRLTLAAVYPLWLDVSTAEQAQHVARRIQELFLRDGGVVTTVSTKSTQQWDSPNGWAPLQYVAYRALLKTPGYEGLARDIRQRWMALNERVFKETGKMMEKYDVVDIRKPAGGGEYETQDGFGWTNGVYLEMLYDQQQQPDSGSIRCQSTTLLNIVSLVLFSFGFLFNFCQ